MANVVYRVFPLACEIYFNFVYIKKKSSIIKIYKDIITADEMFSDTYKNKLSMLLFTTK